MQSGTWLNTHAILTIVWIVKRIRLGKCYAKRDSLAFCLFVNESLLCDVSIRKCRVDDNPPVKLSRHLVCSSLSGWDHMFDMLIFFQRIHTCTLTPVLSQASAVTLKLAPVNMRPHVYSECTEGRKDVGWSLFTSYLSPCVFSHVLSSWR